MQADNFIFQDYLKDLSLCDELIEYHKTNEKCPGTSSFGYDLKIKKSTDCVLKDGSVAEKYIKEISLLLKKYIEKFSYSAVPNMKIGLSEFIMIQQYLPKEAYYAWHCERSSDIGKIMSRHLAFMTYLNDVTDCGETEFYYQQIKFKPKKGLTLIWPVDWTHTHRGITSKTQEKYIATGWFNFVKGE